MNQGRIWCVVHPTVGLPLLLGAVALTSLAVHASVMTHTTWMSNYWQGASRVKTSENVATPNASPAALASAAQAARPAFLINVAPVAGTPGKAETSFVVTVTPNPADAATTASADGAPPGNAAAPVVTASAQQDDVQHK